MAILNTLWFRKLWNQVAYAEKNFEGFKVMASLLGGPGAEPPGRRRNFEILQTNSSRKLQKEDYFRRFFKKIKNHALNFRSLDEIPNCVGNFWENFERFLWKKHKNALFWYIFKIISNPALNFRAFWRKTIGLAIFEKIFKNFFENSTKMPYFGLFSKKFQNTALNFRSFWRQP